MFNKLFLAGLLALSVLLQARAEVSIKSTKPVEPSARTVARGESKGLNLPDDKKQEVERITNEFNNKLAQLRPQIKEKTKTLKTELAKDSPNYEALENTNKELFAAKEQEQLVRIQYQVELSKVLTADQRRSLNKAAKANSFNGSSVKPKVQKARRSPNNY
jgi:Spy/CpxP family protein refolding chaperone